MIFTLLELKLKNPEAVFMSRGNHEDEVGPTASVLYVYTQWGVVAWWYQQQDALRGRVRRVFRLQNVNKAGFRGTFDNELQAKYPDVPYVW